MLGKSVGYWFQKLSANNNGWQTTSETKTLHLAANPEESSRFMRNRPGEQICYRCRIVFEETRMKREVLAIDAVVKNDLVMTPSFTEFL